MAGMALVRFVTPTAAMHMPARCTHTGCTPLPTHPTGCATAGPPGAWSGLLARGRAARPGSQPAASCTFVSSKERELRSWLQAASSRQMGVLAGRMLRMCGRVQRLWRTCVHVRMHLLRHFAPSSNPASKRCVRLLTARLRRCRQSAAACRAAPRPSPHSVSAAGIPALPLPFQTERAAERLHLGLV